MVNGIWLVDCFQKRQQLNEDPYYCLDLVPPDPPSPLVKKMSLSKAATKSKAESEPMPAQTPVEQEAMQDIMSQYIPQQNTAGKISIV